MKPKDLIFILTLAAFTGVSYYGSHVRALLSKNFFYATLAIGGVLAVLWLMLRLEASMEPAEGPCVQCGAWIRRGAKFCGRCGVKTPATNMLSLILDVIFFRWVKNSPSAPETPAQNSAKPYVDVFTAENTGAKPGQDDNRENEIFPDEDYVSYPACIDCGNRCGSNNEHCPVCGGNLIMRENRRRTSVEREEAYSAMLAERSHVLEYMHLTFWDRAFRGRYDRKASEMQDLAELMEAYGHPREAQEMRDKAAEIGVWDISWGAVYLLGIFAIYAIVSVFKK